jgi:hypothetical protein
VKPRLALLAAALAFAGAAHAAGAALSAPGDVHVNARETVMLPFAGAVAAFALDASTVEVSMAGGTVSLLGRRGGRTLVTVVLPSSVETLSVVVEAPTLTLSAVEALAARDGGSWDVRYDSGLGRYTSGVESHFALGEQRVRLRVDGLHDRPRHGASAEWALPFATVEIESAARSIVLLDKLVHGSPLVLDNVLVRGAHLRQGPVELHAGVVSTTRYNDLFIPASGDRVLAASVEVARGDLRFVPSIAWLPDSDGNARGVAALGVASGAAGDRLRYSGELGWGGRAGAAFDAQLNDPRRQISVAGAVRPGGFASLRSVGRPPGMYFDGAWTESVGQRSALSMSLSDSRLDVPGFRSQASSGRLDLRTQASDRLSLNASIGGGAFQGTGPSLRRGTLSAGAAYDTPAFGIAAQYRYQHTSAAERGGHGARLSLRAHGVGWRGTAFLDAQQQAPTVDLILQDRSDLARTLAEMGLSAGNPEELVRLLRDNAALFAAAGVGVGELRMSPLRLQGGLDLSYREPERGTWEIGARLLADDLKAVASRRRSFAATLYASWRINRDTEIGAGYSRWSMRGFSGAADDNGSVQLWARTRFSGIPLPGVATADITGSVVTSAPGDDRKQDAALPGVEVVLDRARRTQTDSGGRFVFERPGAGAHRVEAVLPRDPGAYFTSASSAIAKPGDELRFGLAFSAARLEGTVRSDGGAPLEGVTVRLEGAAQLSATTDSSGKYRLAAPAGAARVAVVAESVPAGYELRDLAPKDVELSAAAPASADFSVRAQRSVSGTVAGTRGAPTRVAILENGRETQTDADGRFVLRGLPAGPVTLLARGEGGEVRQQLQMPAGPGTLKDIRLGAGAPAPLPARSERREPAPRAAEPPVALAAVTPARKPAASQLVVLAEGSVEGKVTGTRGGTVRVSILESGIETQTDDDGRFVLHGVPEGPITLIARSEGGMARHRMRMPAGTKLAGIVLTVR